MGLQVTTSKEPNKQMQQVTQKLAKPTKAKAKKPESQEAKDVTVCEEVD